MVLLTIFVFIGLLLTLVLVHEWGHFMAAKKAGCRVEEFGFGFPPRLWSFMYHGTKYSLNLFPIGGFVKIEGENMNEANPSATSFASKSAGWRLIILSAGVFMNIVLAVVLLGVQSTIGSPTIVTEDNRNTLQDIHTYIIEVAPHSPADVAGLKQFDRLERIGDIAQPSVEQVQAVIGDATGQNVLFALERQGQHMTVEVPARANPPAGEGATGISLASTGLSRTAWYLAPWAGVTKTWQMLAAIFIQLRELLASLVTTGTISQPLTGPIGIAVYTNEVTRMGWSYVLEFAAMISVNLAIINFLPLPALDGGRILFVLIEMAARRRVPGSLEAMIHTAGFVGLLILMVLVTFRDITRYF